eukprot:c6819_g1_i3.p1 GENE.c6819_g1_i3~~c6819_g1_i3.p1  ORF type:complete len:595 (+),score=110.92 c6819_g1_i3:253-1785(+)
MRKALMSPLVRSPQVRTNLARALAEVLLRHVSPDSFAPAVDLSNKASRIVYVPADVDSEILLLLQLVEKSLSTSQSDVKQSIFPVRSTVYDSLLFTCAVTGNYDFLKEVCERGRLKNFESKSMLRQYALALMSAGRHALAYQVLQQVIAGGFDSVALLMSAKLSLITNTHLDECIQQCHTVITTNKSAAMAATAYHYEGLAFMRQAAQNRSHAHKSECQQQALTALGKAYDLDPNLPNLNYHLALHYALIRDVENALNFCQAALRLSSRHPQSWNLLALILSAKNEISLALSVIDAAISQHPNDIELLLTQAKLKAHAGLADQAVDTYKVIVGHLRAKEDSSVSIADALPEENDTRQAVIWLHVAALFRSLNQLEDAKLAIAAAQKLQYPPALLHFEVAMLMKSSNRFTECYASLKKALATDPDHVPSLVQIAQLEDSTVLDASTGPSSNRTLLQTAVRLDPTSHEAWYQLGLAHMKESNEMEAADAFLCAAELEQTCPVRPFDCLPITL